MQTKAALAALLLYSFIALACSSADRLEGIHYPTTANIQSDAQFEPEPRAALDSANNAGNTHEKRGKILISGRSTLRTSSTCPTNKYNPAVGWSTTIFFEMIDGEFRELFTADVDFDDVSIHELSIGTYRVTDINAFSNLDYEFEVIADRIVYIGTFISEDQVHTNCFNFMKKVSRSESIENVNEITVIEQKFREKYPDLAHINIVDHAKPFGQLGDGEWSKPF